jgi:3-oxoacyl-[acyl-carrier-protein] synthase-1
MTSISVIASGMVTAVGFNAAASLAAIRARVRNVKETNLWDASSGEYVAAGRVALPHWWIGTGKLAELVAPAIHECLVQAQPTPPGQIPIVLCVPAATRPYRFDRLDDEILDEVSYRLAVRFHPKSCLVARDQVGVAVGITIARDLISRGDATYCIVAGVDSLIDQPLVEYYIDKRRVLTPANSNGFSPGEAGSAVLIGRAGLRKNELQIVGIGTSREEATIESELPLQGNGLTDAIGGALADAGLPIDKVQYRITDLNGEHYKFKEMVLATMRFERNRRRKLFDLWHPTEYIGDVGAAIGPVVLGLALYAGMKRYGPGPTVLCTFGSDAGERAAMVVSFRETQ